jgi:hypothetical protein
MKIFVIIVIYGCLGSIVASAIERTSQDPCITRTCPANSDCRTSYTDGSVYCECRQGFQASGQSCVTVKQNPCANGGGCPQNSDCTGYDTATNSASCTCRQGFQPTGSSCVKVDPCSTNHGGCAPTGSICTNNNGANRAFGSKGSSSVFYCSPVGALINAMTSSINDTMVNPGYVWQIEGVGHELDIYTSRIYQQGEPNWKW